MNPDTGRPPKRPRASVQDGIENTGENQTLPPCGKCGCKGLANPALLNELQEKLEKLDAATHQSVELATRVVSIFSDFVVAVQEILDAIEKIYKAGNVEEGETEGEVNQGDGV